MTKTRKGPPLREVLCYFQETTFGGMAENVGKLVGVVVMAALAVAVHV